MYLHHPRQALITNSAEGYQSSQRTPPKQQRQQQTRVSIQHQNVRLPPRAPRLRLHFSPSFFARALVFSASARVTLCVGVSSSREAALCPTSKVGAHMAAVKCIPSRRAVRKVSSVHSDTRTSIVSERVCVGAECAAAQHKARHRLVGFFPRAARCRQPPHRPPSAPPPPEQIGP